MKLDFLKNKSLLITGGTGSFGSSLVKYLLKFADLKRLVIFSRSELKQSQLMSELKPLKNYKILRFFIGDIRDYDRLIISLKNIDFVVHAAAMKHIDISEYNPMECIKTNVIGADNLIRASINCNVNKIIALSTDKASNPINLYGASKLAADKLFISSNNITGTNKTIFSIVRYGNVLGSSGSVIPYFQKLANEQANFFPITDERMTRFWITLTKGVEFTLSSLDNMIGGEIFVPKIPSMKIVDIANAISKKTPLKYVGLRPGEKLHESLISLEDSSQTIELKDKYVILSFKNNNDVFIKKNYPKAKRVNHEFSYVSNQNSDWIDENSFKKLISNEKSQ